MAAKTGVKAAVKTAAAKPAAAPQTPETVEKSTALPGVGAPADNTTPPGGTPNATPPADESDEAKTLREAEETRLLAVHMALLEDEARAEDQERAARLKSTQTDAEEGADSAATLNLWALPEVGEFPATITLDNQTRSRVAVAGAQIFLAAYEQVEVTVTEDQFARLAKALTSSARAHKWDNLKGLQVKYDRKD